MSTSGDVATGGDAPRTLTEAPAATLGLRDTFGLWANLGVSLLLPVAAVFVVLSGQPLSTTIGAIAIGALVGATLLALTFDIAAYEPFLFLIGALFVPLAGVFVVAYHATPRGGWDTSDTAPARPLFLLPWVAGFLAYQLTLPTFFAGPGAGWTAWWTARQDDLGIDPTNGWSASLVSLAVAVSVTALICLPGRLRTERTTA